MKKISLAVLISMLAFVSFAQDKAPQKGDRKGPPPPRGEMGEMPKDGERPPMCEKGEMPPPKGEKAKDGKKKGKGDKKAPPKGEKGEMPPPPPPAK